MLLLYGLRYRYIGTTSNMALSPSTFMPLKRQNIIHCFQRSCELNLTIYSYLTEGKNLNFTREELLNTTRCDVQKVKNSTFKHGGLFESQPMCLVPKMVSVKSVSESHQVWQDWAKTELNDKLRRKPRTRRLIGHLMSTMGLQTSAGKLLD